MYRVHYHQVYYHVMLRYISFCLCHATTRSVIPMLFERIEISNIANDIRIPTAQVNVISFLPVSVRAALTSERKQLLRASWPSCVSCKLNPGLVFLFGDWAGEYGPCGTQTTGLILSTDRPNYSLVWACCSVMKFLPFWFMASTKVEPLAVPINIHHSFTRYLVTEFFPDLQSLDRLH